MFLPFSLQRNLILQVSTMAMKHRKLLPASETNQTIDCVHYCDPSCPYGCFSYPDYYYSAPPPPSPLPPPSTKHGNHVSPYIIIIVTLLGSVFLLLSYYVIMVKYWSRFRRSSAQSDGPDDGFLDQNHGPVIDHPIWYINTIGLQPSVINSITVVKYNKGGSLIEGTDCSVCLTEFQEDETLRLLPKCNHAFHIPCIDTWLRSHTNCPLCRAGIFSNPRNVSIASNDQTSPNLVSNENTQMENSENVGELDGNQVGEGEVFENRVDTGEEIDFPQAEDVGKEIENSKGGNELVVKKVIQPMRRSVSMDGAVESTLAVREYCSIDCEGSSVYPTMGEPKFDATKGHAGNSRLIRMMGGSSIAQSLHKGPVLMKRSFSYSGRSAFSRH